MNIYTYVIVVSLLDVYLAHICAPRDIQEY